MPNRPPVCPKCQRDMEQGFVLDHSHGAILQSQWVGGLAEVSRWTGLKLKGREKVPVTTWRCSRCGYLESYAPTG